MSTHTMQQTTVFLEEGIPWWMRRLPWAWKMRLLRGRPLKGRVLMRCNGERQARRVEFDAGVLGGSGTRRFSCPVCGDMVPISFGGVRS